MITIKDYGECKFLKPVDEYKKELLELYQDIGIGIETDTLIQTDLDSMTRIEELIIIIDYMENNLSKNR